MYLDTHSTKALDLMNDTHDHVFLTWNAGTGKSTLLRHFLWQTDKSLAVLAPTGVAALHIWWQTIHSFFHFGITVTLQGVPKIARRYIWDELYISLETLVIDEISMVRADIMDCIDQFLRLVRQDFNPFWWVQMIVVWDLHQLPPIVSRAEQNFFRDQYSSPFFFAAHVFGPDQADIHIVELQKVHRQSDELLIRCLNDIRTHHHTQRHLDRLNKRVVKGHQLEPGQMYITTRNATVDRINRQMLESLDEKSQWSYAHITGKMPTGTYPTDEELELKLWAQVMFVKNDADGRYANGTIGKIVEIRIQEEKTTNKKDISTKPPSISPSFLPKGWHYDKDGFRVGEEEMTSNLINPHTGEDNWYIGFDDQEDDIYTGVTVIVEDIYGLQIQVTPVKRELKEYIYNEDTEGLASETIWSFTQIPLRLARASTIHKAQWKTFDRVVVDFSGGIFASWQAYVALSRCTSLEGMILTTPIQMRDIRTDMEVMKWMENKSGRGEGEEKK